MKKPVRIILKALGVLLLLVAVAFTCLWWRFRPDDKGRIIPLFERIDMTAQQPFASGVKSSVTVRLFEGLPHQSWEREMLNSELRTKQTFKSHGQHFYQTEIVPSDVDALTLTNLATSAASFEEWGGMKLCGGYHPDWLIRWSTSDGHSHELHICLGCHEAKIYGGGYRLYCDLEGTAYDTLKATLSKYTKQRPIKPNKRVQATGVPPVPDP